MNLQSGRDRRYFPRVKYRAYATLVTTNQRWPVHILDLCFNGALVALIHKHNLNAGENITLTIETDAGEPIKMQGKLSHLKEHFLGIECRALGIDAQARLRELLERNKGKESAAEAAERSYATLLREHRYEEEE